MSRPDTGGHHLNTVWLWELRGDPCDLGVFLVLVKIRGPKGRGPGTYTTDSIHLQHQ